MATSITWWDCGPDGTGIPIAFGFRSANCLVAIEEYLSAREQPQSVIRSALRREHWGLIPPCPAPLVSKGRRGPQSRYASDVMRSRERISDRGRARGGLRAREDAVPTRQ